MIQLSALFTSSRRRAASVAVLGCLALTACGPKPAPTGINDPWEKENRSTHAFNLALDKNIVRPLARSTVRIVPAPITQGVANFASNLDMPGIVVNDVLQARLDKAAQNTLRFALNSTIGLGGLFDPATSLGATKKSTDFGETLAVWGVGEGKYIELPAFGPSTQRDAVGMAVDYVMDPLRLVVPKDKQWISTGAHLYTKLGDRGRYSDTVDSILYESADSYAQLRLLYLQKRRHDLGQTTDDSDFEDPYAE